MPVKLFIDPAKRNESLEFGLNAYGVEKQLAQVSTRPGAFVDVERCRDVHAVLPYTEGLCLHGSQTPVPGSKAVAR